MKPHVGLVGGQMPLLKYTLALFLAYPFALILRLLPGSTLKHIFSFIGGIFLSQWVFGEDWIHPMISSLVTYLICLVAPRNTIHILVFIWAMGYMFASHVYRMSGDLYLAGVFDFTGIILYHPVPSSYLFLIS